MLNSIIDIQILENNPAEPVDLDMAKTQCIVDHSLDDAYLTGLIKQCRQEIENICGISIVEKNIILIADWKREQQLPYPPVKTINDIKVKTSANTDGSPVYTVPGCYSIDGGFFNMNTCQRLKISYTTGMTAIAEDLKKMILNLVAFRYQNRGDHDVELSDDVLQQILRYKDFSWA